MAFSWVQASLPLLVITNGRPMASRLCSISARATTESSAARITAPSFSFIFAPTACATSPLRASGLRSRRMVSTSSTWARRAGPSPSAGRRAMLVTTPLPALCSADITWLQSRRTISSTLSTANAWVVRANSVTSMMFRPVTGFTPAIDGRSSTWMIWPRRLTTPSTCSGAPATLVTAGMATISRILKTLMPNRL